MAQGKSAVPEIRRFPGRECQAPQSACSVAKGDRRGAKLAVFLLACFMFSQGPWALSEQETRRVLIVYEQGFASAAIALIDREIRGVLEGQSTYHIDFYTEYMDTNLFPDAASQEEFRKYYIQKYQRHQPDVIIAVGPTPIEFMIESHNQYFHDVPVVICCSFLGLTDDLKRDSQFTGTWMVPDPAKTLDVALQLQTDVKRIIVVNGTLLFDRQAENIIHKSLQRISR